MPTVSSHHPNNLNYHNNNNNNKPNLLNNQVYSYNRVNKDDSLQKETVPSASLFNAQPFAVPNPNTNNNHNNVNEYFYKQQQPSQLNNPSINENKFSNGHNLHLTSNSEVLANRPFSNEVFDTHETSRKAEFYSGQKCNKNSNIKEPDQLYCNMYHTCTSDGVYKTLLCTDGYLFSVDTLKCEKKSLVNCGKRLALDFDRTNVHYSELMHNLYQMVPTPRIINGSLECSLGIDGYFADPEFCNLYHHCLAGVDYAEQCPHQLVWNDRKKMCDWQTNVNCTGRIIPVATGETSFCTDKGDNKYADHVYCNLFHHCLGKLYDIHSVCVFYIYI